MMQTEGGIKKIIVIGAGFGGVTAALALVKAVRRGGVCRKCLVRLVNKTDYQTYTPALYEIAAIPRERATAIGLRTSMCIDLEDIAGRGGFEVIGGEVVGLDRAQSAVLLSSGEHIPYDYLVIALGAETNYFNIPGLEEHSFPLKTFEDAIRLRSKVEDVILSGVSPIHIIVGGGGASGVELSAEFNNFVCCIKDRLMPKRATCAVDITLVEAAPSILPGFAPWLVKAAERRLKTYGIKIANGKVITAVNGTSVAFKDGATLPYTILAWTGGVSPVSVLKNFGVPLSPKGRIAVNEYLEAAPGIYAIGDNAEFLNPATGKPLPGNVPVAEAEARVAAENIVAAVRGAARQKFLPAKQYPYILAVGRKYAIADLVFFRFSGFVGWVLKQIVELRYLLSALGFKKAFALWRRSVKYQSSND